MTTKRRKIVRSVAIRRIKPRKSQIAKRLKLKTQKRKSRNTIMRGGSNKITVYVIEKQLERPKCFIIRQEQTTLDTIYLFFDAYIEDAEITEFVSAATGLTLDDINLQQQYSSSKQEKEKEKEKEKENGFKILFVKLSGFIKYSLSTGLLLLSSIPLPNRNKETMTHISTIDTKSVTKTPINMKNGQQIIDSLQRATEAKSGYSFTTSSDANISEGFGSYHLSELSRFFVEKAESSKKTYCSTLTNSDKMKQLKILVDKQSELNSFIEERSRAFLTNPKAPVDERVTHKNDTVNNVKERLVDFDVARELIADIKADLLFSECENAINYKLLPYINGTDTFTREPTIKTKVSVAYYDNAGLPLDL